MNHSHLKNIANLGFLVDKDAIDTLENLNEEDFYKLVESLKKEKTFMVTTELIKNVLTTEIKVLKSYKANKVLTILEYTEILNNRYSFLQNILMKKLELSNIVSINKCGSGDVSIIGMLKNKEEKDEDCIISLEDPTGEIQASIPKKLCDRLSFDDVVAVSGRVNNKIIFADKLLYPDVSLKPVNYNPENIRIAFSNKKEVEADYVIYDGKIEDRIKHKIHTITNPSLLEIGNVIILIISGFDPLDVLKKRYVNIENSDFLIEPSPDVVFTDKDVNTNYKGISIVSSNKVIDLSTREVQSI